MLRDLGLTDRKNKNKIGEICTKEQILLFLNEPKTMTGDNPHKKTKSRKKRIKRRNK